MKSSNAGPDSGAMSRSSLASGGLGARDQLGDEGRVGVDRRRAAAAGGGAARRLVGDGADEAAIEDGLQRVAGQRIGLAEDMRGDPRVPPARPGAGSPRRTSGRRPRASSAPAVSCQTEIPSGFIGSVIICGGPRTRRRGCVVGGRGDREQRRDRPALDDAKAPSGVRHHSMSWGGRSAASIRRPSCRAPGLRVGQPRLGVAVARRRPTTSPSRTVKTSGLTWPETSASPRPGTASIDVTRRFDVIGSAVNRTPAASACDHPLDDDGHLDRCGGRCRCAAGRPPRAR